MVAEQSQVWMSHSDSITQLPEGFEILATTESILLQVSKKPE
jgi:GMP synthase (glutamine-hydrolysing)